MKLFYSLLIFLNFAICYSQEIILLDTLTTLQKTQLKEDYNKRKESYYALIEPLINRKDSKKIKSIFDDEYKDINKSIDKNEILVNSPLNRYLNTLVSSIQKQNPAVPQDITILVSREFETNAYNTGEGTIIINNYLLNDLDNEDQLVYIICHEMAHQSLNHVLKSIQKYVTDNNSAELKNKTKEIKNQEYNRKTNAENLLKDIAYKSSKATRKREIQADSLGFLFYEKLGRDKQQPIAVLKRLRDSDKESDSLIVNDYKKIFNASNIPIKESWFVMESYDMYNYKQSTKFNTDSLRTHPNCDERIAGLVKQFPQIEQDNSTDVKPTVSAEFTQWQENAVYQNIYNEYLLEQYGNSLYEALKLYNRKPDDFLKKMIGLNFQKLYEAKKKYRLNRYVSQVNVYKYTHSYNLFCSFMFNLDLADLETLVQAFKPNN